MHGALWADDVELEVALGLGLPDDPTFTLDDDALGLLDVGVLGSDEGEFLDVTCDVRNLTWRSGATRGDGILTRWEAGSAALTLNNRDAQFDPTAAGSRCVPMVPVRIRARLAGTGGTITDEFDRPDAILDGYAQRGGSVWIIDGGEATVLAPASPDNFATAATVDVGTGDVDVTVVLGTPYSDGQGLVIRMSDEANFVMLAANGAKYSLLKYVAGVSGGIIDYWGLGVPNDGDELRLVAEGDQLTAYLNGVMLYAPVTDAFNQTATSVGMWTTFGGRWEMFSYSGAGVVAPWVPLWFGYADSWAITWPADATDSVVALAASDGTKLLSAYEMAEQAPVGAGDTAAQRVDRILDEAEWQGGRAITAGGTLRAATNLGGDAWSQLLANQDAEMGYTYLNGAGDVVFVPRSVWMAEATDPDTISRETWGIGYLRYEDATVANDDENLRNIVDASRPSGTVVTRRDANSVARYLPHRWGRNDLPFTNDADVADWANIVLTGSCEPTQRVDELEVLPQTQPADLWPVVLTTQYADYWDVIIEALGLVAPITRHTQVRGWEHTVDVEQWRITYALSSALEFQPFQLDGASDNMRLDVMRLG